MKWLNLAIYAVLHGLVDLVSAGVIFSLAAFNLTDNATFFYLVIGYNFLAFALQPVLGFVSDILQKPRLVCGISLSLLLLALLIFSISPVLTVLLIGVGNALFHLGAGTIILQITPNKATAPGIFVGPGAIGLLVGGMLGKSGGFMLWPFILLLLVSLLIIFFLKAPATDYQQVPTKPARFNAWLILFVMIFTVIIARSFIGTVISFPWKSAPELLIALSIAVLLGKSLGGWLADRFGWRLISVGGLLVSAPLLAFAQEIPFLAIAGMFFFNFTMPVTLVALANMLPGRPGFAFGLTCLALFIGAFPLQSGLIKGMNTAPVVLFVILFAALSLYIALKKLK